ncbi:AAA family ATPase [Micromonospora aurantiaca (nom. illeg.)]|uniref:AAA family ATPase n=1 Tax=Micromonospora aurantiaca (nom. illeg.) TaxID=47850 RepID=UPI003DA2C1B3
MTHPGQHRRTRSRIIEVKAQGYKSIRDEVSIALKPLTVISGTNSSGKSSFMQTLLLLKQTLEAQFDPGAMLLNGPNVGLTSSDQLFSRGKSKSDVAKACQISMTIGGTAIRLTFTKAHGTPIGLQEMRLEGRGKRYALREGPVDIPLSEVMDSEAQASIISQYSKREELALSVKARRNRCFLNVDVVATSGSRTNFNISTDNPLFNIASFRNRLLEIIHVPGLRGNPERVYPRSAIGGLFPGTFEQYVASAIHAWQSSKSAGDQGKLALLNRHLEDLGLTWKVLAKPANDTSVELLVGRMQHAQQGGAHDLVSIADVGFGVSQTLPVLVALVAARPGQIVYLEQPEIHLHPRAQTILASVIAQHSSRGVIVVAETHSSLLIRGVQTAIATQQLDNKDVQLHWFTRTPDTGVTRVSSVNPDQLGRFWDWPTDFDDVAMEADMAYLNAVEEREAEE